MGAVDFQNKLATFSGSGTPPNEASKPDLVGYGVDVYSSVERDYDGRSLYYPMSGTSMATPYVAGIAALYRCLNPMLTAEQVKDLMLANAQPLGVEGTGAGLVRVR